MIRAAFAVLLAAQWFGGGERNTREGAEHFEAGRLEEALRAFSRAEGAFPDAPENDLNIAGVHYRMGEAEGPPAAGEDGALGEALRGYRAALEGGALGATRRDAYYNLANALFRAGVFPEAAAAYGEAIALDPTDVEARQNLERALRAADEREQEGEQQSRDQQQSQDRQQPQDEESPEEQQPQDQQPQEQQPQDEESQDQDPEGERPSDSAPNQEPDDPPESPPRDSPEREERPPADDPGARAPEDASSGEDAPASEPGQVPDISPEQAERILAALADVERAFQEDRLERRRARALRRGRH